MNAAELSVLSSKRIVDFENVHAELACLKKRLLQHYKKVKFPSFQLEKLKNVRKNLAEEKHTLEQNQEMLEYLNSEVEKAVEKSYAIEESTKALEERLESLKNSKQQRMLKAWVMSQILTPCSFRKLLLWLLHSKKK
ncbi:unnamed protein product [Staurois parvus]|uniref:Centromere protein Q n=1 Tax=Staurois parvus TaxID=386267 RepID=A0ABN9CIH1_9NEOB|nr:unnamed protein product [Staurois parvus]